MCQFRPILQTTCVACTKYVVPNFSDFLDNVTDNVNGKTVNDESPHTMRR